MVLPRQPRTRSLAAIAVCASASLFGLAPQAQAAVTCTKVAALNGSDANPGTVSQPYRTTGKLTANLSAGQTGCYRSGEFRHSGTINLTRVGTADAPIRIRSYPGEKATVHGRLVLKGAHTVLEYLNLRDSIESGETHSPSPQILADYVTIQNNDISNNHTAICAAVSTQSSTIRPRGWKFNRNRVHDCGRMPATNKDHGLYVSQSLGGEVAYNVMYNNADRGVQFYPNADNTYVHHNVISGNGQGVIFGGATVLSDGKAGGQSDNNLVENNVIAYSNIRDNIEASWGGGVQGKGNLARNNCVWKSNGTSGINLGNGGFTATSNTVAEPKFVNRTAGDYRLSTTSPCLAVFGSTTVGPLTEGDVVGGTSGTPLPAPTPVPTPSVTPTPTPAPVPPTVVTLVEKAAGRSTKASSTESLTAGCKLSTSCVAGNGVDTSTTTRWSSAWREGEWWQVDLGRTRSVERVEVVWYGNSWAPSYRIQVSTDGTTWTTAANDTATGNGPNTTTFTSRGARYIRVLGVSRAGSYGISFTNVKVFGAGD